MRKSLVPPFQLRGSCGGLCPWAALLGLVLASSAPAWAGRVLRVSPVATNALPDGLSWPTAFRTIPAAINAAAAGDEIWVASGSYPGPVTLEEGVALYGGFAGAEAARPERDWNAHESVLDGAVQPGPRWDPGMAAQPLILAEAGLTAATRVDGFVIRNGGAAYGAGIYVAGGRPVFVNNTFVGNTANGCLGGGGIFVDRTFTLNPTPALAFFTNVADRLLRSQFGFGLTDGIQVHPTNFYTAEVHRLLQAAANLYDATTNRGAISPHPPSVFRPVFTNSLQEDMPVVAIIGYEEVTDASALDDPWLEVTEVPAGEVVSGGNVFGVPWVVGAKKGWPNFNEFHLESLAQVSRYLRAVKKLRDILTGMPGIRWEL